jgi:hypothetical protein
MRRVLRDSLEKSLKVVEVLRRGRAFMAAEDLPSLFHDGTFELYELARQ